MNPFKDNSPKDSGKLVKSVKSEAVKVKKMKKKAAVAENGAVKVKKDKKKAAVAENVAKKSSKAAKPIESAHESYFVPIEIAEKKLAKKKAKKAVKFAAAEISSDQATNVIGKEQPKEKKPSQLKKKVKKVKKVAKVKKTTDDSSSSVEAKIQTDDSSTSVETKINKEARKLKKKNKVAAASKPIAKAEKVDAASKPKVKAEKVDAASKLKAKKAEKAAAAAKADAVAKAEAAGKAVNGEKVKKLSKRPKTISSFPDSGIESIKFLFDSKKKDIVVNPARRARDQHIASMLKKKNAKRSRTEEPATDTIPDIVLNPAKRARDRLLALAVSDDAKHGVKTAFVAPLPTAAPEVPPAAPSKRSRSLQRTTSKERMPPKMRSADRS